MTERGRPGAPGSRRVIDLAIGILMGPRCCPEQDAFEELIAAVHDVGVGPGAVSRALVGLVEGSGAPFPHRPEVIGRWGHLLTHRTTSADDRAD